MPSGDRGGNGQRIGDGGQEIGVTHGSNEMTIDTGNRLLRGSHRDHERVLRRLLEGEVPDQLSGIDTRHVQSSNRRSG